MHKVELLAPAGNLEKLKMALVFGADAVYLGGEEFSLRALADNFSIHEMKEGVEFAHRLCKKVFLTMNIFLHNEDIEAVREYIDEIKGIEFDAVIFSDPGMYLLLKEMLPEVDLHLSTQANNTNYMSVKFWAQHGIKRIVLARELSLSEISRIKIEAKQEIELEAFVHGAMCISYSGRCLLSNYMIQRDANKGQCAHPCRWKYSLMEEKRPGEYFPVFENERGTFIFNSKDLCMIAHIPELIQAGITSLKIEGRIKSAYYVATVVKAYRNAIDTYYASQEGYHFDIAWMEELEKASHRDFTTGFYFHKMDEKGQVYKTSSYTREYNFLGVVKAYDRETGIATVEQRNRIFIGDQVEIVPPNGEYFVQEIRSMKNSENEEISVAPHPQMTLFIPTTKEVPEYTILRKKAE